MKSLIINIARNSLNLSAVLSRRRIPIILLLIPNIVLRAGNDTNTLDPRNRLMNKLTGQIRVNREPLPHATTHDHPPQRTNNRAQEDIRALLFELARHTRCSLRRKPFVPSCADVQSAWPCTHEIRPSHAISRVLQTQPLEPQPLHPRQPSNTAISLRRRGARGQAHLLLQAHLPHQRLCLAQRIAPRPQASDLWRRVNCRTLAVEVGVFCDLVCWGG